VTASSGSVARIAIGRGRAIGLDLGEVRIGVAVSDSDRRVARPHSVLRRSGDRARDHRAVTSIVEEYGAALVVVGLPLSLSGRSGPAADRARDEAAQLAGVVGVPVELWDERLSTVEATRVLRGPTARTPRRSASRRGQVVDDVAAAIILQAWIDARPNATR
jgi:putative Holliday junction resolvase